MKSIPELIAYYEPAIAECDRQLDRLAVMVPSKTIPETMIDKWIADYTEQRQIVRDTAAYLSALAKVQEGK